MNSSRYDCPFNSIADHEKLFTCEKDMDILKNVTHIMDCECYCIKGKFYYREVSVIDMETCGYNSVQCYAENLPSYNNLDIKSKKSVDFQQRFHGLKYYNYRKNTCFYSQLELLNFLHFLFSGKKKQVLVGYKGGNIESKLCKILNILAVNLEHFGIEKYDILIDIFNVNVKRCHHHDTDIVSRNCDSHCSLYEVFLFAARLCHKLNELEKKEQILIIYNGK